jgi:GNAT superfamily N-acetyltransferase
MIKKLEIGDLSKIMTILKQDVLKECDGNYPQEDWVANLITNSNCFAFGLYYEKELVSVLLSEKLSYKGCLIWFIATADQKQGCGYASELLEYFEAYVKKEGVEWLFLNATENSLEFYSKHKFITSKFSKVYEHLKYL